MRHMIFNEAAQYPVALLIKGTAFNKADLEANYLAELNRQGIPSDHVIGFTLEYNDSGKAPVKLIKEYLGRLLPALDRLGVKFLYVADANYFKVLTKQSKAEPHVGYALPCKIDGFEHMQVILGLNHQALLYNPEMQGRLDLSLAALCGVVLGNYKELGCDIIHKAEYPETLDSITDALDRIMLWPRASCDIEAFSLAFTEAGIGTVSFARDEHHGIAFACDYKPLPKPVDGLYGEYVPNPQIRKLLRDFFTNYPGRLRYHGATFDLRTVVYTLWMDDPLDYVGMLKGLHIMTQRFDCTMAITYLATNSCAGNQLGLKPQAHEFAGNWAQDDEDIKDIRRIPLPELLQYNLVDTLCTNYVYDKHISTMSADLQEDFYYNMALPTLKTIIQMELVGMPMDQDEVSDLKAELEAEQAACEQIILGHVLIAKLNAVLRKNAQEATNAKLKVKQHPIEAFADPSNKTLYTEFNPGSNQQLQILLYELMGLPVIDWTKTKQPATGAETIEKLINHTNDPSYKEVLSALITHGKVTKILTSFIPAFENALLKSDGMTYLHGSFRMGPVSGRLSSAKPNMQNLPANSKYGKPVKKCFKAPKGWLFCGADFMSLEDRINALLTKDPQKLKVYTDGFDGHCLRAHAYFGDQMPDIVNTVESINSISDKYKELRQESKTPTFAMTYLGTWRTLMKNLGWTEEKAKRIYDAFCALYTISLQWVDDRIKQACNDGYAVGAFGLRIRTPMLAQSILGLKTTPREAEAEARTLGNAISGQSYGLLTNRAANAFMEKVWASPYATKILPMAQIHDAIYLLIKDELGVVEWVNNNLIKEMEWQELPELQHDKVKLGAELDIFWPSWAESVTLKNNISRKEILKTCREYKERAV